MKRKFLSFIILISIFGNFYTSSAYDSFKRGDMAEPYSYGEISQEEKLYNFLNIAVLGLFIFNISNPRNLVLIYSLYVSTHFMLNSTY